MARIVFVKFCTQIRCQRCWAWDTDVLGCRDICIHITLAGMLELKKICFLCCVTSLVHFRFCRGSLSIFGSYSSSPSLSLCRHCRHCRRLRWFFLLLPFNFSSSKLYQILVLRWIADSLTVWNWLCCPDENLVKTFTGANCIASNVNRVLFVVMILKQHSSVDSVSHLRQT